MEIRSIRINKTAFTLIELLVVIGIISILVALILPAVQAARESARRSSCMNNVRNLNLATQQFHDLQKSLQPGWIGDVEIGHPGWGWASFLLPFVEQENLHEKITFDVPVYESPHVEVVNTYLPSMACPSDAASGVKHYVLLDHPPYVGSLFENDSLPMPVAASNYVVFFSSELYEHPDRDLFL